MNVGGRDQKENDDDFFKRDPDGGSSNRPMVMQDAHAESAVVEASLPAQQAHAEVISMGAARDAQLHEAVIRESMMANFDPQDDLDVPAFMRKRNETM
jgi:hypothetical protein